MDSTPRRRTFTLVVPYSARGRREGLRVLVEAAHPFEAVEAARRGLLAIAPLLGGPEGGPEVDEGGPMLLLSPLYGVIDGCGRGCRARGGARGS